jgi:hypothetical protein
MNYVSAGSVFVEASNTFRDAVQGFDFGLDIKGLQGVMQEFRETTGQFSRMLERSSQEGFTIRVEQQSTKSTLASSRTLLSRF